MPSTLKPGQELKLTVLSSSQPPILGILAEADGPQLTLLLSRYVPFAEPVKVECDGVLLLGDVCFCEGSNGQFTTGVTTRHRLEMLRDLANLHQNLAPVVDNVEDEASGDLWKQRAAGA